MTLNFSDSVLVKIHLLISALLDHTKSSLYRQIKERFITCKNCERLAANAIKTIHEKLGDFRHRRHFFNIFAPLFSPFLSLTFSATNKRSRPWRARGKGGRKS